MEVKDLAERILQDIKVSFIKEPNIDEFDIIPVFNSRNKSPVVVEGTKMALEAWAVKLVWMYVYQNLMNWRENRIKVDDQKVIQWSEIVLLVNPDMSTVWNIRKELILANKITFEEEYRLCRLILTRKPKSSEVFIHRRWILRAGFPVGTSEKSKLIADELLLATIAASKYSNNYCAWSQREWIHNHLSSCNLMILLEDLKWNECYVQKNVSDNSGFQFRQFLLRNISHQLNTTSLNTNGDSCQSNEVACFSEMCNVSDLHKNEWRLVNELMEDYARYEALWYYRRFVIQWLHSYDLVQLGNSTTSASNERPVNKKTRKDLNDATSQSSTMSSSHLVSLDHELHFIFKLTTSEFQNLAVNYKRWLTHFFKLDLQ